MFDPGGGGFGAKVSPPRPGGTVGVGTAVCREGAWAVGAELGLVGPTEKISAWLRWSKGLEISAGTSTFFCMRRRVIKAGLSRGRMSPKGNGTMTPSRSASGVKRSSAACRNSPKVILTVPRES